MKILNFNANSLSFGEKRLVFMTNRRGAASARPSGRPRVYPALSANNVKKGDRILNSKLKQFTKLKKRVIDRSIQTDIAPKVIPQIVKNRLLKMLKGSVALFKMTYNARQLRKIIKQVMRKMKRETFKYSLNQVKDDGLINFKKFVFSEAKYKPKASASISVGYISSAMDLYKNLISKLNKKVPPQNLKHVIRTSHKIAHRAYIAGISSNVQSKIKSKVKKNLDIVLKVRS